MDRVKYVIPGTQDNAIVYVMKYVHTCGKKEYASAVLNYYVQTSYGTYIIPSFESSSTLYRSRVVGYIEFSPHALKRMKERIGKDFDQFYQEDHIKKNGGIISHVKYDYNGDEREYVAHVGDAFLIVNLNASGKKYEVKTLLSRDELYSNQLKQKLDSKRLGESIQSDYLGMMDEVVKTHRRELKANGVLATCA